MKKISVLLLAVLLAACAPAAAETPTSIPAVHATSTLPATEAGPTEQPPLSFEPAVYEDGQGRFQFLYPAGWMLSGDQGGSRGSYVQLTSWQHDPAGFSEIPEGETVVQVAIYQWDPTGDLPARIEMRRSALLASGNVIVEETPVAYPNGPSGVRMLIEDTNGDLSVLVFLLLGDDYLELSGLGNAELADEILGTFEYR